MKTKAPLLALSLLTAAAMPVAQANAKKLPKTTYFNVRILAHQNGNWTEDMTASSPLCGVSHTTGHGNSKVFLAITSVPVTVKRTGTSVRFLFPQSSGPPKPDVAIGGTLERHGEQQGTSTGAKPGCPKSIPVPPDCGVRHYDGKARLALLWNTPGNWPFGDGGKPHTPSLHLRGPYGPDISGGFPFANCIGERDDYQLGVPEANTMGVDSGPAALSLSKLFNRNVKKFTVKGHVDGIVPHVLPTGVTGGFHSTLSLNWTVEFKRLSHPGKPDPIDLGPLSSSLSRVR